MTPAGFGGSGSKSGWIIGKQGFKLIYLFLKFWAAQWQGMKHPYMDGILVIHPKWAYSFRKEQYHP
jgi:hypothetical protein